MTLPNAEHRSSPGILGATAGIVERQRHAPHPIRNLLKPAQSRSEIDTALNSRSNAKTEKCKAID